jgi:glycosyltransferase involved in cell wall biosynthesis
MKLTIVDSRSGQNELDRNAMGGTELQGKWLAEHVDPALLDNVQIIRSRVRELEPDKKHILWLHDLPWDPESAHLRDPKSLERFDKIVCVSNWQMQMYSAVLGLPYSKCEVLKNAIHPIDSSIINKPLDKIKLIYHPTPHRGLEILVPVFDKLCQEFDNIELDVYSSFKLYGWEERDKQYAELFEQCKNHPHINYHGSQPNEVVRKALAEAHIFAYPSIWMETSCICLMEAMSAECFPIVPNLAALPETGGGFPETYQWDEDKGRHADKFYHVLRDYIIYFKAHQDHGVNPSFAAMKHYADTMYSWNIRSMQWTNFLSQFSDL